MRSKDLLWILAFPFYYLLSALRHELAHAIAAALEGAEIQRVIFWPFINAEGQIRMGAASWLGQSGWLTSAMPYLFDLLVFLIFFYICMAVPFRRQWIWINLIIIGIISPLINSGYTYLVNGIDITDMAAVLPGVLVHIYFIVTLLIYIMGLVMVFSFSRTALPSVGDQILAVEE